MIMLCWMYCGSFFTGLFLILSPLLIIFSLFVLKRGVFQNRIKLRQLAFFYMFAASLKFFTIDIYIFRDKILCSLEWFYSGCNISGVKILQLLGAFMVLVSGFLLFYMYRRFTRERRSIYKTPKEAHLRLWANIGVILVISMIIWLIVPWVSYLTVGYFPDVFLGISWRLFALFTFVIIMIGFWKIEDCNRPMARKRSRKYVEKSWVPADTLWIAVILLCLTSAFFYISEDSLSKPEFNNPHNIRS